MHPLRHFVLKLNVCRDCPCAQVYIIGPGCELSPIFGRNMAVQELKGLLMVLNSASKSAQGYSADPVILRRPVMLDHYD